MKQLIILSFALAATAANAQAVPNPGACRADAAKLCPSITGANAAGTNNTASIESCLTKKIDQVSAACKENMAAMKAAKASSTKK
jgi:hypothetical protein